ncbi:hypothetical protein DFH07DRAFT_1009278 [Mycena maculata]|uniref:Uncharacterized protein n=1 Tax=Mycena maculata TaxID=230809 RepID=A0AAD7JQ92_9AGAR|nr:hypothetical protein DFH07DRAFT_1009278 [Mycena maculata]
MGGEDWYEDGCLGPNYARLARFIKGVATTGAHTTRTAFGPGASYFSVSPSGYSWQNIPSGLEDDIHNCMKIRRPTSVALGVQGSYVVLYNDGTVTFDLRGHYPMLEAMIHNMQEASRRCGVMYVALNPFIAGEFYAVYGDGSASWNFPTAWTADVSIVSREIKPVPVPSPVAAAAPSGTMVACVAQPVTLVPGGTAPASEVISPTLSGGPATGIAISVGHAIHQEVAPQVTSGTLSSIPSSVGHKVTPQITGGTVSRIVSSVGHAVAPKLTGGTVSRITSSIGHTVQAVAAKVSPAPPPPYTAQKQVSHIHWQEDISLGLKAAEGINKIIHQNQQGSDQWQEDLSIGLKTAEGINKIIHQHQQGSNKWQEDLTTGLKAAEGINKIIHVFEDQNQQGSNQPAQ